MKRAAVWKGASGNWWTDVCQAEHWQPSPHIDDRAEHGANPRDKGHPTHALALHAALEAVGLTSTTDTKENTNA